MARCNNREFSFTKPEDFAEVLTTLCGMIRIYALSLYAYTLRSNRVRLPL